eukprot:1326776-Amphidinium_carterae.1
MLNNWKAACDDFCHDCMSQRCSLSPFMSCCVSCILSDMRVQHLLHIELTQTGIKQDPLVIHLCCLLSTAEDGCKCFAWMQPYLDQQLTKKDHQDKDAQVVRRMNQPANTILRPTLSVKWS